MPNTTPFPLADNRQSQRASLEQQARCRWAECPAPVRVRLRNISARGVMADGEPVPLLGQRVEVELPETGWVEGVVAWVEGSRFGIGFVEPPRC